MNLAVSIALPDLWGDTVFQKDEWGTINFLVGPNGTGKSLFAEKLKQHCQQQGLNTRYLSAERLAGLEKQNYGDFGSSSLHQGFNISRFSAYKSDGLTFNVSADAFVLLKEKLDLRIRIEATLSQLFGRTLRLVEEGGFLKPKIQKRLGNEYSLKENECHGLKELISLLTFLYDDEFKCLIIDEPELHLHPQFQTFFLQEVRKNIGDPLLNSSMKCVFIVTHSPYFVDVRTVEDLRHCVIFQPDKPPSFIDKLEGDDEWKIRRLLPKLNTHHKQFFFASRPVFVEGYTDQQLFTLIQEKRGKLLGASGACIIDVGGKDEMDLFFRLCKQLNIDAQCIADLDVILEGKLRQSASQDPRCSTYVQAEGLGVNALQIIGDLEKAVDSCIQIIEAKLSEGAGDNNQFTQALAEGTDLKKKRYTFLLGLIHQRALISNYLATDPNKRNLVEGRLGKIIEAFKECNIYILEQGALEHYLPSYTGGPYSISDKVKAEVFETERTFILSNESSHNDMLSQYGSLILLLDEAISSTQINMDEFVNYTIGDWIHKVQAIHLRSKLIDIESLKQSTSVDWASHSRIFDITEFVTNDDGFRCKLKLKPIIDPTEREVEFNDMTVPTKFKLGKL
jgi:hypothetical protein